MDAKTETMDQLYKTYKVDWYRCPVDRATFRELGRRSDLRAAFQAVGHLVLVACTGALTYYFFVNQMWVGFGVALWVHGTFTSHLIFGNHELGHGTLFRTRWLNALFLRIYSLLTWWNFHEYAMSHTYHHSFTLHRRADQEVVLPKPPSLAPLYLLQLFTFNVTGGFESRGAINIIGSPIKTALGKYSVMGTPGWLEALYVNRPELRQKAVNWARLVLVFHFGIAAVSFALGLWALPIVVSLGPCIANWYRYFIGVPMHCGLRDDVPDFRKCVRTITLDPFSSFLYWRMNWHIEHHMFASIPAYNLKKLYQACASDMPKPRTLIGAWREMRQTWHKQREDPSYQFDTPLPAPAEGASADQDPEAASIGEIAPAELRAGA